MYLTHPTILLTVCVVLILTLLLLTVGRKEGNEKRIFLYLKDGKELCDENMYEDTKAVDMKHLDDADDICDQLYEHDNDINHMVEQEAVRVEQEMREHDGTWGSI